MKSTRNPRNGFKFLASASMLMMLSSMIAAQGTSKLLHEFLGDPSHRPALGFEALLKAKSSPGITSLPVFEPTSTKKSVLDEPALEAMVRTLGYPVTVIDLEDKRHLYMATIKFGTWQLVTNISISPDGSNVWFTSPLVSKEDLERAPAGFFQELMVSNNLISPCFYKIDSIGRLVMSIRLPNHDITREHLEAAMSSQVDFMISEEIHWNPAKWPKTPKAK